MEVKTIIYDPKDLPISNVSAYSIVTKKIYSLKPKGGIWILELTESLKSDLELYQILINDQFFVPDLTKKCVIWDETIVSVLNKTRDMGISPKIDQISLSKNIYINKKKKTIQPMNQSLKFNSLDQRLHCIFKLKNVTIDFPIVSKIYDKNRIVYIFDEWLEKSDTHNKFERTFYFSVNTTQFSSGLWNIELETPFERYISQFEFRCFGYTSSSSSLFDTIV
ncbi:MAG: hypothetical protein N2661_03045 [Anoxybacillus mongoliensis]|nr:hypothetical protein [Anoxybacillus mongoliensis]